MLHGIPPVRKRMDARLARMRRGVKLHCAMPGMIIHVRWH
jgi:hypothetical protein